MVNLMVNSALDNSAKKGKNMVNYFENVCSKSPSTIADINLWTGRDLNPRPLACEASITTPELPALSLSLSLAIEPNKSQYKTSRLRHKIFYGAAAAIYQRLVDAKLM
jgi:hypothetical protein